MLRQCIRWYHRVKSTDSKIWKQAPPISGGWSHPWHHWLIVLRGSKVNLLLSGQLFNLINDWIPSTIKLIGFSFIITWWHLLLRIGSWFDETVHIIGVSRITFSVFIIPIKWPSMFLLELIKLSYLTLESWDVVTIPQAALAPITTHSRWRRILQRRIPRWVALSSRRTSSSWIVSI